MRAVLLAIALIATPAQARMWVADDCSLTVVSVGDGFEIYEGGQDKEPIFCKVEHWPVSDPVGLLSCDNGQKAELELSEATIRFDGVSLPEWTEASHEACE